MTTSEPRTIQQPSLASRSLTGPLLGLVLVLGAVGLAYSLAWSGGLYFDDESNLGGLAQIHDRLSAGAFIFSGTAGPLGRPVALATFALQAEAWPDPRPFLIVNTFIHLINTALIFWLALLLARLGTPQSTRAGWFALAVAACWAASPFLANSSLMIVQRMSTLSALFVFLGLIGYVQGRLWMRSHRSGGTILALGSLTACTALAVFSKENGALLPVLALVIEATLIRQAKPALPKLALPLRAIWLYLPTAAIVLYLGDIALGQKGFAGRDFSLIERLLTQARVLWEYVFYLLLPKVEGTNPFTDHLELSRSLWQPPGTLLAVLGLALATVMAWLARKRWPFLTFGIVFFAAGHLVESTVVALELYFAHRNYIPAFGLFFALLYPAFFRAPSPEIGRVFMAGAGVYALLSIVVLASAASLWGNPRLAAEIWSMERPHSVRALQNLSRIHTEESDLITARRLLELGLQERPMSDILALQRLGLCPGSREVYEADIERAKWVLRETPMITRDGANWLQQLVAYADRQICPGWTRQTAIDLVAIVRARADFENSNQIRAQIYLAEAELAAQENQWDAAADWVERSQTASGDAQRFLLLGSIHLMAGNAAAAVATRERFREYCGERPRLHLVCRDLERVWEDMLP